MISRKNWKSAKAYSLYRREVDLISEGSSSLEWHYLRKLLEWADDHDFNKASKLRPTFSAHLGLLAEERQWSVSYVKKILRTARNFFIWLTVHKKGYSKISRDWIDTLKPPRIIEYPKDRDIPNLEYMMQLIKMPAVTMREQRIKASICFWFLSGIRVGAFVSLPIKSINLNQLEIYQWPSLGVRTKFKKHATTFMINIPDLLESIYKWDEMVRRKLHDSAMWFAPIRTDSDEFLLSGHVGKSRSDRARKDCYKWLSKNNLKVYSPHKFRHGHAVFMLKRSDTVGDLKAVSQNLMHSSLQVTDSIYSVLEDRDIKSRIQKLSKK